MTGYSPLQPINIQQFSILQNMLRNKLNLFRLDITDKSIKLSTEHIKNLIKK